MRNHSKAIRLLSAVAAILTLLLLPVSADENSSLSKELLTNPTFAGGAKGWFLRSTKTVSDTQIPGQIVVLNGVKPGPDTWSHVGVCVYSPPTDHELKFSCFLRAEVPKQKLMINAFAYDKSDNCITNWSAEPSVEKGHWTQFKAIYNAPSTVTRLTIYILNSTAQPAYVCQASLKAGKAQKAAAPSVSYVGHANTLLRARYKACVKPLVNGGNGVVTFPIPGLYREQVPLTFDLTVEPPSALLDYRFRKREDGINWLCEVRVKPPKQRAFIKWDSLVLVKGRKRTSLPKVKLSALKENIPKEALPWLRSTACVQSADPGIRKKSEELGKNIDDVESYVQKVIEFTAKHKGRPGVRFDALDAKKALACGGSCTSKANLAAAILRAHGIPARTVSHLPAWYEGPMFEHWLVEYWHPDVGWVWIEPTLQRYQPTPNDLVLLAVSSPEDEDKAFDPIQLRYIMPGAAYLSGCLLSKELMSGGLKEDDCSGNTATTEGGIEGTDTEINNLFESARNSFLNMMKQNKSNAESSIRSKAIQAAAKKGKASELKELLTKSAAPR